MEEMNIERTVPFSLEAEKSVLGAMFLDMKCIPDAIDIVKAEDFYIDRHKELYSAIIELYNLGKPVDIVTLKDRLTLRGTFDTIGGIDFIVEIANFVPTTRNIKHYAKIVAEKSTLRKLINISDRTAEKAYTGDDEVENIVAEAENSIMQLSQENTKTGLVSISAYLSECVDRLSEMSESNSDVTGVPTGFVDLDKRTAGLHGSEFVLIAARPGIGKTTFAINIAQNVAIATKLPVAIFSLEMPGVQLANRMLASEAMVTGEKLKRGDLKDNEWERIGKAFDVLSKTQIYIDDTSSIRMTDIAARCRRLKAEKGLGLIVVDYIQLMQTTNKDRQQGISEISRMLKILAKDLDVPVIALSQLNREVEKQSREPRLSDIRESGSIEQDADMVMMLHREDANDPSVEEPNKTKCIIAKHRNGETGSLFLTWIGEYFKFSNWSGKSEN